MRHPTCNRCKGVKNCGPFTTVEVQVFDRSGKLGHSCKTYCTIICPACMGKGHITQEDRERICTE